MLETPRYLRAFSSDTACKLNVLGEDGDPLCVDRAQVRIFKKANKVRLCSFLKRKNSRGLEAEIRFEVLGNFANETLERKLPQQKLGGLLITTDFPQSDSTRPVAMRLFHATSGGS